MIVALSLVLLGLITVLVIANMLEQAPMAFEDERGFHVLSPETRVSSNSGSAPTGIPGEAIG